MVEFEYNAIERLLGFLGYGNPAGVWFVGKEEGLSQMDDVDQAANLFARGRFGSTMDLQTAHLSLREGGRPYDLTHRANFTQVWLWAAKIARSMSGAVDWPDVERAKDYIRQCLGRSDGQTFLTIRSPIPEKGGSGGRPWRKYFDDNVSPLMLDNLLAKRHQKLNDLIATCKPKVIICHGGPREAHRALVLSGQPCPSGDPRIESYDLADGRHVFICPFFGVGQMRKADAEVLVKMLRDRDIRL